MESSRLPKPRSQQRPSYQKLAELLAGWRGEADMTQRELALQLKLPQSTIAKIETAHRGVDVFELIEWCRACDVDPKDGMKEILKSCRL